MSSFKVSRHCSLGLNCTFSVAKRLTDSQFLADPDSPSQSFAYLHEKESGSGGETQTRSSEMDEDDVGLLEVGHDVHSDARKNPESGTHVVQLRRRLNCGKLSVAQVHAQQHCGHKSPYIWQVRQKITGRDRRGVRKDDSISYKLLTASFEKMVAILRWQKGNLD